VESSNSIRTRFLELTSFDTGGLGWPTGCAGLERAVRKKKRDQAALCKLEKNEKLAGQGLLGCARRNETRPREEKGKKRTKGSGPALGNRPKAVFSIFKSFSIFLV
jgi:hypothetical protein